MATQSTSLSAGTAPNHAWHSTGLWCFATDFSWNRRTLLPQRSTCAWRQCGGSPTKPPTRHIELRTRSRYPPGQRGKALGRQDRQLVDDRPSQDLARSLIGGSRPGLGVRIGNWLTIDQARTLLDHSSAEAVRAKRDQAILAVLVGRSEEDTSELQSL